MNESRGKILIALALALFLGVALGWKSSPSYAPFKVGPRAYLVVYWIETTNRWSLMNTEIKVPEGVEFLSVREIVNALGKEKIAIVNIINLEN